MSKCYLRHSYLIFSFYIFFGLSVFLLLSSPALSAEHQLTEQDYFADVPLILSATRLPQSAREAPVAVTVIDREMIEASGYREIPDLLRLVPGFIVDYDSGHIQAAGYHLLPNRFVRQQQVLIDGRSVYSPNLGGVQWTELPITIDDIDRIEVVRGANAATYGSNSMLGIVNIITKDAVLDHGVDVKTNIGSNDIRDGFLRYGSNATDKLDYRINAAYRSDNGFDDRYDGKIVRLLNTRFDYQIDTNDSLMIQAGYSEGPREEDNTLDSGIPNHIRDTFSQFQQIKWQHVTNSDNEYYLQFYHTQISENKSYTRTDFPILFDEYQQSDRYDLEFQQVLSPYSGTRFVWGASYRNDSVKNPLYLGTRDALSKRTRRLFGHAEYRIIDNLLLNAGLMLEDNDITGTELSPRIALNYAATADDSVRIAYSRATRTPVLFEEYPNAFITNPVYNQYFFDNGSIESETVDSYEIAWVGNDAAKQLFYDFKIFREDVKGLISYDNATYPDFDNQAAYFDNFDDIQITGFEGSLDYRPNRDVRIYFSYANIHIDSDDIEDDYSNAAPEHSATLLSMFKLPHKFTTSVLVTARSEMKPLARRSFDPETMPDYVRLDWRTSKSIKTRKAEHKLAFVIQNLFDNVDFSRLNNFQGREYYFTYQVHFH